MKHEKVIELFEQKENLQGKSFNDRNELVLEVISDEKLNFVWRGKGRNRGKKLVLGTLGDMTLEEARELRDHMQCELRKNTDHRIAVKTFKKSAVAETVGQLAEEYYNLHLVPFLKSAKRVRGIIRNHILPMIGEMNVREVGVQHAYALVENAKTNGVKASVLTCIRQLFEFAYQFDLVEKNKFRELSRKRFRIKPSRGVKILALHELDILFEICAEYGIKRIDLLALVLYLTLGVRKCELLQASWKEFNLEKGVWNLSSRRTKTNQGMAIPLAPQVIGWLSEIKSYNPKSNFLFPARKKCSSATLNESTLNRALSPVFKKLELDVHSCRHLASTLLQMLGVDREVREVCLNHREGEYSHYHFFKERQEALQKLATEVAQYVPDFK